MTFATGLTIVGFVGGLILLVTLKDVISAP